MKTVCVLGMGYIGLPTALLLANGGNNVIGVDINEKTLTTLREKRLPFEEEGLQELLDRAFDKGTFSVSGEVEPADVFIVAVPTPFDTDLRMADLKYVISACEMIKPRLKKGNLVIIESTIPPRTCEHQVTSVLESETLRIPDDIHIAHCPERAIPGNTLHEMVNNDRVIGGLTETATQITAQLYSTFVKGKLHLTNSTTAELVKLMENTYRDVNIALANELTQLSDDYEIDIWKAIRLANLHPRVNILKPGPGVGGHCIAIDPWFLTENSNNSGMIFLSRQINDSMPQYVIKNVKKLLADVKRPVITVFGVAYKADVADTRATPANKFIKLALKEGYMVRVYDPFVKEYDYPLSDLETAVNDSDCIVIITDHSVFAEMDPAEFKGLMARPNVFDTRNIIDRDRWKSAGFNVQIMGITDQQE